MTCEGKTLRNTFFFKYLGSIFAADGTQSADIDRRIGIASTRAGQLRHIFGSKHITMEVKLRLYGAAVCSLFSYGCEAWFLTDRALRKINGANSRLLARFTGRTIHEEARRPSFDMLLKMRQRRLSWLGHILRLGSERLVQTAVKVERQQGIDGSIWMDAPDVDYAMITTMATRNKKQDWKKWSRR